MLDWLNVVIFFLALILGLVLVWAARRIGIMTGYLDIPREDRWHRKPTPKLGGVGVFGAAAIAVSLAFAFSSIPGVHWSLLAAPMWMFILGLYDDFHPLPPSIKLLGQIAGAIIVVFLGGFLIHFFPWPAANVLLTLFWLVGITNAINLLDNMDGLAGGVALIAAGMMSYLSYNHGDQGLFTLSMALAGAVLAFLCFNFPPARIFMGDSGSMFIGFTLAELAVARRTSASNVLAVMGVPILVFILPILDTTLVTVTRLLRGQSPAQGGRDHTSHRLVSFGLNERQVVLILCGIALLSGTAGVTLEALDYDLSLALFPVMLIALVLLTAYLGRVRIVSTTESESTGASGAVIKQVLKTSVLELLLDLVLVGVCYYLAFWVVFGFDMTRLSVDLYLSSWPITLVSVYSLNYVLGIYRAMWSAYTVRNLLRHFTSAAGSSLVSFVLLRLLYPQIDYPLGVFLLFFVFLFMGLAGSRASFVIFDQLLNRQPSASPKVRVFLYDASSSSEMLLRWFERSPDLEYQPVGIIDNNKQQWGRSLRGVPVVGGIEFLHQNNAQVVGVLVTNASVLDNPEGQALLAGCRQAGLWVRLARIEFELLE